jgi:predicted transcriptional regulator
MIRVTRGLFDTSNGRKFIQKMESDGLVTTHYEFKTKVIVITEKGLQKLRGVTNAR